MPSPFCSATPAPSADGELTYPRQRCGKMGELTVAVRQALRTTCASASHHKAHLGTMPALLSTTYSEATTHTPRKRCRAQRRRATMVNTRKNKASKRATNKFFSYGLDAASSTTPPSLPPIESAPPLASTGPSSAPITTQSTSSPDSEDEDERTSESESEGDLANPVNQAAVLDKFIASPAFPAALREAVSSLFFLNRPQVFSDRPELIRFSGFRGREITLRTRAKNKRICLHHYLPRRFFEQ